jgi:hypothetical protein
MTKYLLQILILLSSAFLFAQSPNDIAKYLEKKYKWTETFSVGSCLYTGEELPKIYIDPILKKYLPNVTIYTFLINEKGCYGLHSRKGVILEKDGKKIEQLGLWSLANDHGLSKNFIDVFKLVNIKNVADFKIYVNSIAKLLFSTYYENEFIIGDTQVDSQTFNSKDNRFVKFDFLNNQITDIKYRFESR